MPLQIPEGFGHAKLIFSLAGDVEEMVCTFGYDNGTLGSAADNAAAIRNAFGGAIPAVNLSNAYSFLGAEVTQRTGGQLFTGESRVTVAGSGTSPPPPQNCCLLVKKTTNAGGRAGRGRMYLPAGFLTEGSTSAIGIIDSGTVTAYQALLTDFLGDLSTANLDMVLLHSDVLNVPDVVQALTVDNLIATQRSRLRGR